MAFQDSNAERRNLTVLSLSIIVFYLADGEFTDDTVRLQLINATFNNPKILVWFVWGALGWFFYRYWLTSQRAWRKPLYEELSNNTPKKLSDWYLVERCSEMANRAYYEKLGMVPKGELNPKHYHYKIDSESSGGEKLRFQITYANGQRAPEISHVEIKTYKDKCFILLCSLYVGISKPTITGHFYPYVLLIFAVILGVFNFVFDTGPGL